MKKLIISTLAAAVVLSGMSSSFAAPKQKVQEQISSPKLNSQDNGTVPMTGAEWWQNRGNAEDMGMVYRSR